MDNTSPIGIFDSGLGGLTVLKKLVAELPNENYIYFGDTARIPYGEKTREQLICFVREILDWYQTFNPKAILMACNTSSAVVLDVIKDDYNFPIFGLIQPTASYIAKLNESRIGIIATSATIKSKAYSQNILALAPDKQVFEISCPGLVEIVESGKSDTNEAKDLVNKYVQPLLESGAEKIVLGCTHYPFLKGVINEITNKPEMLIDPADHLINTTKNELKRLNLLKDTEFNQGERKYYVSAKPEKFVEVGNKFFSDCTRANEVNLNALSKL